LFDLMNEQFIVGEGPMKSAVNINQVCDVMRKTNITLGLRCLKDASVTRLSMISQGQ